MAQWLFWVCGAIVLYTYVIYPLLIWLLGLLLRRHPRALAPSDARPRVAVIVPVHNGRPFLEAKLASLRAQTYPRNRIQLIFVSDGSDDGSTEMLNEQSDVKLIVLERRTGKPNALNLGVAAANEDVDVLVLTDVRQPLSKGAVAALVSTLSNPDVGVAGGALVLASAGGASKQIGLYWRYEQWIRRSEVLVHSTAGASGALYALRLEDFTPLPIDTLLDDFEIPIGVLRKGKRIVLVPEAIAYDTAEADIDSERIRKIRTLSGNFQSFARHRWLFSPLANPIFFQFVSHKVLRLLVPYALFGFFAATIALDGTLPTSLALAQLVFYAVAWLGSNVPEVRQRSRLVTIICAFVELNWAAVIGLLKYLSGRYSVKWEKTT